MYKNITHIIIIKGQIASILGFAGCKGSVITTQLCHCGSKAAIIHQQTVMAVFQ